MLFGKSKPTTEEENISNEHRFYITIYHSYMYVLYLTTRPNKNECEIWYRHHPRAYWKNTWPFFEKLTPCSYLWKSSCRCNLRVSKMHKVTHNYLHYYYYLFRAILCESYYSLSPGISYATLDTEIFQSRIYITNWHFVWFYFSVSFCSSFLQLFFSTYFTLQIK